MEARAFSPMTLAAEIARYLNLSPVRVERILRESDDGMDALVDMASTYNRVVYEVIIPRLFDTLYEGVEYEKKESEDVQLVKPPEGGFYSVQAKPDDVVLLSSLSADSAYSPQTLSYSFHLDTYAFDSKPEQRFFREMLGHQQIKSLYFTGMLTHGQTDFFVQYIDPESRAVRSYYPDFLIETVDGKWLIVEVKGDNKVDDPIVQAKQDYASQLATASAMEYRMIRGNDVLDGLSAIVLRPA